jgi:catechol 2,3-dioxygenase-like lactoylglutathione lyase family enzyme
VGFKAPRPKEPPVARLITGVDFITVSTKDFAKARDFYANVLGLEESKRWGSMPAQEFETGNLTIAVMQSDAFGMEHSTNSSPIEFHVHDFEGAKAELESRGVDFKGEPIDPGVCLQTFSRIPTATRWRFTTATLRRPSDGVAARPSQRPGSQSARPKLPTRCSPTR